MTRTIRFPQERILDDDPEYDPNDPGVDMSAWLEHVHKTYPHYDEINPNADERPF